MGTPRILDPEVETAADLWPRQRAAIQHLVDRRPDLRDRASLRDPTDLASLPFTTKTDLQAASPLAGMGVPRSAIVRIHASSGTSGTRTLSAYTAADITLWTRVVARGLASVGVNEDSLVYSTLAHGLFTGGFGFHQAATALGAAVVPGSVAPGRTHAELIRRLRPDVLFATPSYAQHLLDRHGPLPPIALGVFGAEPWTEADRARLERVGGMVARDTYGLSEVIGPGVAFECPAADGMHINADHFVPEVVDADGQPVPDGVAGELVLTAATRQARPLLRYRTGDRTHLTRGLCSCGRTLPRMARITGRVDDMRVVRGVNVHPADVATVLATHPEAFGSWTLELRRPAALDMLTLVAECAHPGDAALARDLARTLRDQLGLRFEIHLLPLGARPHRGGKTTRWRDHRAGRGEDPSEAQ